MREPQGEGGYIKLSRSILRWGWYADQSTKAVFLDILLHANYEEAEFRGHTIGVGEAVISQGALAERLGLTVKQVRRALNNLYETGEIALVKRANRFTIVRVEKWDVYQGWRDSTGQSKKQLETLENQHFESSKNESGAIKGQSKGRQIPAKNEIFTKKGQSKKQLETLENQHFESSKNESGAIKGQSKGNQRAPSNNINNNNNNNNNSIYNARAREDYDDLIVQARRWAGLE